MSTVLLVALPILVALLNRVRGGWIEGIRGASAYIAGAALSLLIFLITYNYMAAGAFLIAYIAGESFGWGKWVSMIPKWYDKKFTQQTYLASSAYDRDDGKNNGVHFLANLIAKEDEDFRDYGWWALVFRGMVWWAPILAVLTVFGLVPWYAASIGTVILGFAFPITYTMAYKMFKNEYWGRGELMYGFVQGLVLAASLYLGTLT